MNLPARITIREVGARDGLQSEAPLDVDDRLELLDALLIAGVTHLEVAAFVSPAAVPAMAGAADVVRVHYLLPDAADFEPCWPVLREYFAAALPAATMMVVGLASPAMKIEIEVTALKPDDD